MGITFNDLMTGIVSKSLKMHMNEQKDKTDVVTMAVPLTFQSIPKDMTQYKFGNNFASLLIYLELKDNLVDACASAKNLMDQLKKSMRPAGGYSLNIFYTTFMPHYFMDFIYHKSAAAKLTLYLSNVPGFLKPVYYGGQPAKRFFSLNSGVGNVVGVSIVSMPEIAQFSITADQYNIEDLDTFMSYFDDCIKEL